jgi:hypothetical protein
MAQITLHVGMIKCGRLYIKFYSYYWTYLARLFYQVVESHPSAFLWCFCYYQRWHKPEFS